MMIVHLLDWQYDGDAGWWVAMAYASPVMLLFEPFSGLGLKTLGLIYLAVLVIASAAYLWMRHKRANPV